jgi:NAD+ synthetase
MKIALAQINPRVGDLDNNTRKILTFIRRALEERADLVVFPEMAVLGYPPLDLLEKKAFVAKVREKMDEIARASAHVAVICGFVSENKAAAGKPLHNSAALCVSGKITAVVHKSLLPTYDVFDERRYFEPSASVAPVVLAGRKIGLSICEDIWNDRTFWSHPLYSCDPVEDLVKQGAEILVNIAASPFAVGRPLLKERMLSNAAHRHKLPLVAVNQVGGNTSLLFEGGSKCFNSNGDLAARADYFEEDFIVFDTDAASGPMRPAPENDVAMVYRALVMGTRDYLHKCGFRKAVIGLSGGIDSALVAKIATDALGAENVLGVSMPSRYSSDGSKSDAAALARNLGIELRAIPIEPIFKAYLESTAEVFAGRQEDSTEENIQARIRGNILMAISNKFGHLVLTTGNKSELAVGYCTLYGDMSGGLAVIGDVPKTLVYEIARYLNRDKEVIPANSLTKPPSAELKPDQTDQDSLPPYEILDPILKMYVEESMERDEIVAMGHDARLVEKILRMVDHNEYKRTQAAPCLRVTTKAFGFGRRIPIAQGWR